MTQPTIIARSGETKQSLSLKFIAADYFSLDGNPLRREPVTNGTKGLARKVCAMRLSSISKRPGRGNNCTPAR